MLYCLLLGNRDDLVSCKYKSLSVPAMYSWHNAVCWQYKPLLVPVRQKGTNKLKHTYLQCSQGSINWTHSENLNKSRPTVNRSLTVCIYKENCNLVPNFATRVYFFYPYFATEKNSLLKLKLRVDSGFLGCFSFPLQYCILGSHFWWISEKFWQFRRAQWPCL